MERVWKGQGLSAHTLARLLEPFGIQPTQIRIGDRNIRSYRVEQFSDAFDRYLAPETDPGTGPGIDNVTCTPLHNPDTCPMPPVQTATPLQCNEIKHLCDDQTATPKSDVAV
jgi:uncharacterized protein DUF3631